MNVLLIGSGGREHALAVALAKSPLLTQLFVAPGNPGTARVARNVALDVADFDAVIAFCRVQAIGFVVIGPEQPLVDGLVDALEAAGIKAFGPSKAAARLEGSKGFTKDICARYRIPTGASGNCGQPLCGGGRPIIGNECRMHCPRFAVAVSRRESDENARAAHGYAWLPQ